MGFSGFIDENTAATVPFQVRDASNAPVEPDAAPTWRLFGQSGQVSAGAGTAASFETGTVTGATNANPIVVTSAGHGLPTGAVVTITGVGGNTNANGTFVVTSLSSSTFSVPAAGNSAYTSGGAWKSTGLYKVTLTGSVLASLEAGKTYTLVLYWQESGQNRTAALTLTVR